ncbi:hypothetical protein [Microcoleus asticus]|uniref:Uncharacterized protein n=1 Tax=Microcoleus asticus IPMA8 TaxID=2563858 RepID=A0ABX2CUT9_9CYAN|nr:hypothetical protein [Microcoleus asticus IPMA8]
MTIWLNAHRSPAIAVWISATFSDIHQRSDRRYFSIILGIVPQLRYNYKIYRQHGKQSAKAQGFLYGVLR